MPKQKKKKQKIQQPAKSEPKESKKLQDLYATSTDENQKYCPEKYHWEILKEFRDNNMKYCCMKDIEGYKFKAEDETGFLKKLVANCQSFFNKKINDSRNTNEQVDLNMLCHYEVNQITGEKFLRLVIRQWKTSYDPEVT